MEKQKKQFVIMGCGGTFDLLHDGHKAFLLYGLACAEKLLIGISSDAYASERKYHPIESYAKRKQAVETFLRQQRVRQRAEILPLDSVYIPKEWEKMPIEAILVTQDSRPGAERINKKLQEEGKPVLTIIPSPLCLAQDGLPLSSSRIREGVIDRKGNIWIDPSWDKKTFTLPTALRSTLRRPFGEIVDGSSYVFSKDMQERCIAVGDVTTAVLQARNILPKMSVVDLMVERKRRYQTVEEMQLKNVNLTYTVQNTPGHINSDIFRTLREAFLQIKQGKTVLLHVHGEEDLLVLPILLYAPLGWTLCYGQPKKGMVKVAVDEKVKLRAKTLLNKFTIR